MATVNNEGGSMLNDHKNISTVDYKETGLKDGVLSKTNEPKARGIGFRLLDKFNKTITSFRVEKKGPERKVEDVRITLNGHTQSLFIQA
ncbi:hypothetical protein [Pseudomonas lini]